MRKTEQGHYLVDVQRPPASELNEIVFEPFTILSINRIENAGSVVKQLVTTSVARLEQLAII